MWILVPAGGFACVCLLVVQQKQMSTWVNFPVARRGNVVVSLLRLGVQLRVIFAAVACCWYFARASDWMTLLPESSGFLAVLIVAQYKPFVPYPLNPRALFSRELFRRIPVISSGCFARARLLPESSGFVAVLIVAKYKVFMLVFQHVAYTHGNPGSTAGRGFNPAGGAPGDISDRRLYIQMMNIEIKCEAQNRNTEKVPCAKVESLYTHVAAGTVLSTQISRSDQRPLESAVELAMETSRVDSVVRNQARRPKLNQLEHINLADDEDQLQALKRKVNQLGATVHQQMLLEIAIAKRCRLHKLIRQHFALALKIQQEDVAMEMTSRRKEISSYEVVDPSEVEEGEM
ncbi:protein TONSOKU-like [Dorcoceras hygrometricum]|uniref:Protein TONSOKU-like n=1 Tax=Dorcoceras hygrometricum TaxID=472368 RepID=A0A2Z7DBZ2_9LAMI|nr:protein TONSOKU-like [Dorcoceras hygrometricum]